MQQRRRSDGDRQCGNTWSAFENESQEVGSSRKNEKCKVSFSLIKKNKAFQKSYMKVWVKNLLRTGMVPARAWRPHAVEMAPTEIKIEEADGGISGKKGSDLPVFLRGSILAFHSDLGRRSFG